MLIPKYVLTLVLSGIVPGPQMSLAQAQDQSKDEDLGEIPADKPDVADRQKIILFKKRTDKEESSGVKIGNFTLSPSVALVEYYDDNIYATESQEQDDFVTVIVPAAELQSNWKVHAVKASAGIEIARYADFSTENTDDRWFNVAGRYDLNKNQNVFAGLGYQRRHEDRATPEAVFGENPVEYDNYTANLGHSGWYGDHQIKLAYTFSEYDFLDIQSSGAVILNDDRDRTETGLGLRYLYRYTAGIAPFLQVVLDERKYELTPDYEGFARSSDGLRADIGINILRKNTVSKLFVGQVSRDYDSADFDDPSETDFGVEHTWKIADNARLIFNLSRSIQETTLPGSPGYLLSDGSLQWQFMLSDSQEIKISYAKADADYYQDTRNDVYESYLLGYARKIVDEVYFNIDLQQGLRESTEPDQDYTINQIYFRISASM